MRFDLLLQDFRFTTAQEVLEDLGEDFRTVRHAT